MSEHFIKKIVIKNFKCFKDFKAEGFGRVNLIGGKNNVGKTAFMEACFLSRAKGYLNLYERILELDTHRNIINNLLSKKNREEEIKQIITENHGFIIYTPDQIIKKYEEDQNIGETKIIKNGGMITISIKGDELNSSFDYHYSEIVNLLNSNLETTNYKFSINFISQYSNSNDMLNYMIGEAKLNDKYNVLNLYIEELFDVKNIDFINNRPMLKINDSYKDLSTCGQGIKTFINIISSMLLLKDDVIFIDELENGIHYTHLDRLWEIILTISKQQNVQVFATTHSKECIESYARVAKKLEDEEIGFIQLGRNKKNELDSIVMNSERFQRFIELGNEVRGW